MLLDLSQFMLIDEEKIPGSGEDSHILQLNSEYGFACALDGCGGSGARKYPEFGGRSGAYLGSRAAADTLVRWFSGNPVIPEGEKVVAAWETCLKASLTHIREQASSGGRITGKMVREFPTTLAGVLVRMPKKGRYLMDLFWAGDSRVYLLDGKGLHQLTRDDLQNSDPLDNLRNDAPMTNVISADARFSIHCSSLICREPGFIFAATDGAFGYLQTPMHFEAVLLSALHEAGSMEEWQEKLRAVLGKAAADDVTLAGILYGFRTFDEVKKYYYPHLKTFWKQYRIAEKYTEQMAEELWQKYRREYEWYPV